jgi:hypothetical protein
MKRNAQLTFLFGMCLVSSFKDATARIILNISRISSLARPFANVLSGCGSVERTGWREPCSPDAIRGL